MAKITNPLMSVTAQGTLGKAITFRKTNAGAVAHRYPKIGVSNSTAQQAQREKYQDGCTEWNGLDDSERLTWDIIAEPKQISGFNAFMAAWLLAPPPPPPVPGDPYFANVKILMQYNGTNGDTAFTEAKGNSVTNYGGVTISNAQSAFGGTSGLFDGGNSAYLSAPNAGVGAGDFTIEARIFMTAFGDNQGIVHLYTSVVAGTGDGLAIALDTTGGTKYFVLYQNGTAHFYATAMTTGSWHHIEVVRSSGVITCYFDGVAKGSVADTSDYSSYTVATIGSYFYPNSGQNLNGYMDEFCITDGIARHTADFTPPASEYPGY